MLVDSLQGYLAAYAPLQAELGTKISRADTTNGIFPSIGLTETTMPYIVMMQISGEHNYVMEGVERYFECRWRFSCYGTSYRQAKKVAKVLKDAIVSIPLGALPSTDVPPKIVWMGAHPVLEADDIEPIPHGTIYATHLDFEIQAVDNE